MDRNTEFHALLSVRETKNYDYKRYFRNEKTLAVSSYINLTVFRSKSLNDRFKLIKDALIPVVQIGSNHRIRPKELDYKSLIQTLVDLKIENKRKGQLTTDGERQAEKKLFLKK